MKKAIYSLSFFCIIFLVLPTFLLAGEAESLSGHWEGSIELPGQKLDINLDFQQGEDGTWQGDISIPAQKTKDLPLANISVAGSEVQFEIAGVPGQPAFKGTLREGGLEISGKFTQGGQSFPFVLKREISPAAKAKQALNGFEDIVEKGLKDLKVPGAAIAIVKDDEVIFAKGFGYRDMDNKLPLTADTLLAIGSSSKAFTTFAMGTLVDEGKMDWEKPVRTYIPWFRLSDTFASERMTPRDLVTHRSGLPRHDLLWYNNDQASREELVRRLADLPFTADLREKFQYNNLMFLTAGYLVEVLTGKTWEDAIRSHVFEPLGMKKTNFSVVDSQKDPDFALPYRETEGTLKKIPFRNITNVGPAGAINSSVNEMSSWVMVHINQGKFNEKQVIQSQTLEDMHLAHMPTGATPAIPEITPADYGLGWFVDTYRGHSRVHHGGNIDGFSAMVSLFPQDGLGFVALSNKDGTPLPELLIRHAADLILSLEPKNWISEAAERKAKGEELEKEAKQKKETRRVKGTKPAHKLEAYAGEYNHPSYGDLKVFLQDGHVAFTYNGITTPLEHWHYETFNGLRAEDPTFENMKLTFRTDVNGYVAGLETPFEATLEDMLFQKKPDSRFYDASYLQRFVGKYDLAEQILTVSLKGNSLTVHIPGQPEYDLVPALGEEFIVKQIKVIRVRFILDEAGQVKGLEFIQPGGVFEAKRIDK